jgi:hypothetical protein
MDAGRFAAATTSTAMEGIARARLVIHPQDLDEPAALDGVLGCWFYRVAFSPLGRRAAGRRRATRLNTGQLCIAVGLLVSAERDELREVVERLRDDQVPKVLAEARRRLTSASERL